MGGGGLGGYFYRSFHGCGEIQKPIQGENRVGACKGSGLEYMIHVSWGHGEVLAKLYTHFTSLVTNNLLALSVSRFHPM